MSDDELTGIEEWLHSHLLAEPLERITCLIAEVRRQRDENRAMQSRLDIAEERKTDGMDSELFSDVSFMTRTS